MTVYPAGSRGSKAGVSLCMAVAVMSLAVSMVTGRICYKCDSRHGDCPEDSVEGVAMTTCSQGNEYCEVVKDNRDGEPRFIRDCVVSCDKDYVNWKKGDEEYCKTCCDDDSCNVGRCGGNSALLSQTLLLVVFSVIIAFCGMTVVV